MANCFLVLINSWHKWTKILAPEAAKGCPNDINRLRDLDRPQTKTILTPLWSCAALFSWTSTRRPCYTFCSTLSARPTRHQLLLLYLVDFLPSSISSYLFRHTSFTPIRFSCLYLRVIYLTHSFSVIFGILLTPDRWAGAQPSDPHITWNITSIVAGSLTAESRLCASPSSLISSMAATSK